MSKKHRKISLVFIVFLLTLLTVVSFAEPPEAPNQLITENPYKEVKTVEADKNREHAEMNLSVNKIHIKEIEGINLDTGEIVVYLPEEEILKNKIISNETYYVTDSIEKFPDISTVSGKKYFSNSNRFLNKALDNDNNISFEKHTNYISIQKKNDNELYLGRLDIKTGEIKNIWKIVTKTPKSGVAWVKFLPYSKIEVIKDGDEYKLRFGEIARANRTYSASPYDKEENPGFNFNYMLDADFINESNSSYTFKNNIETKTMGKMLYLKTATYHSPVAIDGSFEFRKNNNQFLTPKIKFEELYTATGRDLLGWAHGMYAEIKLTKQEYIDITIKKLSNLVLNTDVKAAYIPSGQGKRIATLIKTNEIESNNSIPMLEPVKRERTISFKQDQFQKVYSKLEGSANFNLILTKNGEVRFLNNKTFSNSILLTKGSDYINSGINSFDYSNNLEIFDRDLITASPGTINVLKCNSGDVFLNTNLPRVENKIKLIYHTIGKNIWSTPNDETIIGFEIFAENSLEDFIASITEKGDFFQTIEIPVYDKEKIEIYLDKLTIEVKKIDIPKETINFSGRDLFEQDYSNREFQGMVKDENLIVLKNGETEIFRETLLSLKEEKGKEIPNSGISMSYGSESNKFIFRKEKFVNYNENLKLEIRTSKNTILYTIDIQLINSNLETDTTITFESNNFNMIKGDELSSYGRIRIYPTSNLSYISNIGILDLNDTIVADKNRKNGQFLQATVSGNTYPLREHHFGKSIYVTMDGEKKEIPVTNNINEDPTNLYEFNQSGLKIGIDYQALNTSNGGIDFVLMEWHGKAKTSIIKVEYPDGAISNYTLNIPEFEGKNYYNEKLPLANEYLLTKKYTKEINSFIGGDLDSIKLGTKNYDLRILGNYSRGSELIVRIPKKIILKGLDVEGNTQNLIFNTRIDNLQNATLVDSENEHTIHPKNDGYNDLNSEMNFEVILFGAIKNNNLVTLTGTKLNLVSIGSVSPSINKMTTIIDEVEYKNTFTNTLEVIDFRDKSKDNIILGNTQFEAVDTNKIIIKDNGTTILSKTILEFQKGVELPDTGIKIIYDSTEKKLKFERIGYKNYINENLTLELRSEGNLLLRTISLKLYNDAGFEILPKRGVLEFGHFIPGDFKRAESLIEFKNPGGAKINIELDPNNIEEMYRLGPKATLDETIPLSNIQIKDLKEGMNKTNSFKISGEARTTESTKIGDYRGELNVIITIIP